MQQTFMRKQTHRPRRKHLKMKSYVIFRATEKVVKFRNDNRGL